MKILVATVGTGRFRSDIADAIARSVSDNAAKKVYLLCSQKTWVESYPLVAEKIKTIDGNIEVLSDVLPEGYEDHFDDLFKHWNKKWNDWGLNSEGLEVVVDFTSGTKPMSAAVSMLGVFRGASKLSYVYGKRDSTGRAVISEGTHRILPEFVYSYMQLRRAAELFNSGDYSGAVNLAKDIDSKLPDLPPKLAEVAWFLNNMGTVYREWERFSWKKTSERLRRIKGIPVSVQIKSQLSLNDIRLHIAYLKREKDSPTLELAVDLIENSSRCMRREKFDDALSRLYRATELIVQLELHTRYGIATKKLAVASLTTISEDQRKNYLKRANAKGEVSLGLEESYKLLMRLRPQSPLANKFHSLYYKDNRREGVLAGLLQVRNQSLLAHGFEPIDPEKVKQLFEHVNELLMAYAETREDAAKIHKVRALCKFAQICSF